MHHSISYPSNSSIYGRTSESANHTASKETVSFLDQLRQPKQSELARKRKVPSNPPPKGSKKGRGKVFNEPVNVSPAIQLKEFPDQALCIQVGKLFCSGCREPLSLKKSIITLHIQSAKHIAGLQRLKSKEQKERGLVEMLQAYDNDVHPVGESLPDSVHVYRLKVLSCFMKAGVPINKLDCFRNSLRLSCSSH